MSEYDDYLEDFSLGGNDNEYSDSNIKRIVIPGNNKYTKNKPVVSLDNFVEIPTSCIVHLHNSYLKFLDKTTMVLNSGGFLVSVDKNNTVLRLPGKKENIQVLLNNCVWYVKNDNPNYLSIQSLIMDRNKIIADTKQLKRKMEEFEIYKKSFSNVKKFSG